MTWNCLICSKATKTFPDGNHHNRFVVDRQTDIIFLLKELLKLSSSSFLSFFTLSSGQNPEHWINLCDNCSKVVGEAKLIFGEDCRLQRKLKQIERNVTTQILNSRSLPKDHRITEKAFQSQIASDIQEFVRSSTTPTTCDLPIPEDPSLGDRQAEQLLSFLQHNKPEIPTAKQVRIVVKEEVESDSDYQPDFDEADDDPDFEAEAPAATVITKTEEPDPLSIPEPDSEGQFRCTVKGCGKVWINEHKLKDHLKYHRDRAAPKHKRTCNLCGKVLTSTMAVKKHKRVVHEGKGYTKEQQQKWYEERRQKLKKCPHCDFESYDVNLLAHLKRNHRSNWEFKCGVCKKNFKMPADLKRHEIVYHNKCYAKDCEFLGKSKSDLREHQVEFHGKEVNVFKCLQCGLLKWKLHELKRHVKKMHSKGKGVKIERDY